MPNPNHRFLVAIFALCVIHAACAAAHARVLHIGDNSFRLDTEKHTTPALALQIDDTLFWGALYPGTAPAGTMHVKYDGMEYWLAEYCEPGTYLPTGGFRCTDCGIGHYCMGGKARQSCTWGAISCSGANHAGDAVMPDGAPINKFMTLDEVNEFMPPTDFAQWREISCCNTQLGASMYDKKGTLNDVSNACASGTIGPGTYLFAARYFTLPYSAGYIDIIDSTENQLSNAFIVVFDHPVSYASMHGEGIFQHFVDTDHAQYTAWTISSVPVDFWCTNKNETNVSNLANMPGATHLCVYELQ